MRHFLEAGENCFTRLNIVLTFDGIEWSIKYPRIAITYYFKVGNIIFF